MPRVLLRALLLAAFVSSLAAAATEVPPAEEAATTEPAPLVLQNRTIVEFRVPILGVSPAVRARLARTRIETVQEQEGALRVTSSEIPDGTLVSVDGVGVFVVTPGDVDGEAGDTPEGVATRASRALEQALAESEELRSPGRILWDLVATLVATLIAALLLLSLRKIGRFIHARIERVLAQRTWGVKVAGSPVLEPKDLGRIQFWILRMTGVAASLVVIYVWLFFCLERFPYTRPWGENLGSYLLDALASIALGIVRGIPGLFFVVVIALIARLLTRALQIFFRSVESGAVHVPWVHRDTVAPTRWILTTTIWLFALALSYPYLPGSQSLAFKGMSVFVGLMISLGSTNLSSQVSSGLVVMYSRTLKKGEYVRIGEIEGTVTALGILTTRVRTIKNEEVTIPNSVVASSITRNFSRGEGFGGTLLHTTVTIGYSAPWRQVHALLLQAAGKTEGLSREPAPFVLQRELADFYVQYEISARIERPEDRVVVLAALHANIQDLFNEHGVQIMSPHYFADPADPVVVPKEKWYEPPAAPPGKTP